MDKLGLGEPDHLIGATTYFNCILERKNKKSPYIYFMRALLLEIFLPLQREAGGNQIFGSQSVVLLSTLRYKAAIVYCTPML